MVNASTKLTAKDVVVAIQRDDVMSLLRALHALQEARELDTLVEEDVKGRSALVTAVSALSPTRNLALQLLLLSGAAFDAATLGAAREQAKATVNHDALRLLDEWTTSGQQAWQGSTAKRLMQCSLAQAEVWIDAGLTQSTFANLGAALELLKGRQPSPTPPPSRPVPHPWSIQPTSDQPALPQSAARLNVASGTPAEADLQRRRVVVTNSPPAMQLGGLRAYFSKARGYLSADFQEGGRSGLVTFTTEDAARRAIEAKHGFHIAHQRLHLKLEADVDPPTRPSRNASTPRSPRARQPYLPARPPLPSRPPAAAPRPCLRRPTRVYLGNLAPSVDSRMLGALLEEAVGEPPLEVRIESRSYGRYAFGELWSSEATDLAIKKLHGRQLEGKALVVERPHDSYLDLGVAEEWPFRVVIDDLPLTATTGDVQAFVAVTDPSARDFALYTAGIRRFAYFNVSSGEVMTRVIGDLRGRMLGGKKVSVRKAGPDAILREKAERQEADIRDAFAVGSSRDRPLQRSHSPPPRRRPSSRSRSPPRRSLYQALTQPAPQRAHKNGRSPALPPSPGPIRAERPSASPSLGSASQVVLPLTHDSHSPSTSVDTLATSPGLDLGRFVSLFPPSADLSVLQRLMQPHDVPPEPSHERIIPVCTTFGYLPPADAQAVLEQLKRHLHAPSSVPARMERPRRCATRGG